jgi:hypothetical protein
MNIQQDDLFDVNRAIMRIHTSVLALVSALLGGFGLFVMTAWLIIKGGTHVGQHLALLNEFFPGYSVTWFGSLVGLLYGALVGGVGGWVVGLIYNIVANLRN